MRKEKLDRYRAVVQEQRDFMTNIAPTLSDFKTDDGYQKREAEINNLYIWLQEDKQLEERERAFDHAAQTREDRRGSAAEDSREVEARALDTYLRTGQTSDVLKRANMASNGSTTGAYLVPTFVSETVIQDLNALESVRRLGAQVIPVEGNTNIPIFEDAVANFIAEAQSITATDPTVARVEIKPNLLVCRTTYSWQLANRSVGNLVDQLRQSFVRGIGKTEASKFLYGSGTNEPAGLIAGISATSQTAANNTFTATELLSLYWGVNPMYANTGTWIMSPAAAAIARSLESTNGAQLWYPNLKDGTAELMGRPVVIDANMDTVGTGGKKPVAFVSVPDAYVIGEETGLSVFADPYTAAGTGESKLYVFRFVDGRVKKSAAGKALAIKTS